MIGHSPAIPESAETLNHETTDPVAPPPAAGVGDEVGGRGGLDPVRYGDWEKNGRCIDF
jgi:hypothetical protein